MDNPQIMVSISLQVEGNRSFGSQFRVPLTSIERFLRRPDLWAEEVSDVARDQVFLMAEGIKNDPQCSHKYGIGNTREE